MTIASNDIGSEFVSIIKDICTSNIESHQNKHNNQSIFFAALTEIEIEEAIKHVPK